MITTERTTIVPFDMEYLDEYFNYFDAEITEFQWLEPFEDCDLAGEFLQGFIDEMNKGEALFCAILIDGSRFIGSVEVHGLDGDCPELGIWIIPSEQNKGYAYSMSDDDFKAFADYQMHICEKREMLGNSSHLLYICRKNN